MVVRCRWMPLDVGWGGSKPLAKGLVTGPDPPAPSERATAPQSAPLGWRIEPRICRLIWCDDFQSKCAGLGVLEPIPMAKP